MDVPGLWGVLGSGIAFASWGEAAFVLLMLPPLAFFAVCAFYLWRLLLNALPVRSWVAPLHPPLRNGGNEATQPVAVSSNAAAGTVSAVVPHFVLLIPAHNEELLLGAALDSLNALDYPRHRYDIVVIADNCADATATIARGHQAYALERFNKELIGKGYALEWALDLLKEGGQSIGNREQGTGNREDTGLDWDAVVILDADTLVSSNMLRSFAQGLAQGQSVMQARYEVLNTEESWRTRLMACALALAHIVKPLGRERLRLSDGLKGNGMCFAREVVENVPWSGESITEDIEYTLRLCRAGHRVVFRPDTAVWAQMPTTGAQATSQRKRWEGGRYRLLFTVAPRLLAEGIRKWDRVLIDRAAELIIPPFAEMFALPIMLLAVCAIAAHGPGWEWATRLSVLWLLILALQVGYLIGGMWVARVPAKVALSLLRAPFYIVWKFGVYGVMAVSRSAGGWKRTERRQL